MLKLFLLFLLFSTATSINPPYGSLQIRGRFLTNSTGKTVQLRGLSLMPSAYASDSWTANVVQQIKCFWNCNIIRAAVPVNTNRGGWMTTPSETFGYLKTIVDAAISNGIYVIIDWHIVSNIYNSDAAKDFFGNVSKTWGKNPNILYEIWNEPTNENTWAEIKPQLIQVIDIIRKNDPSNVILVGSPNWSTNVDAVVADPIQNRANLAYSYHYYAASHKQTSRDRALGAINKGLPLFITEYGTVDASGNGAVNVTESNLWWDFNDKYQLSYVNWVIYAEDNAAGIVNAGTKYTELNDTKKWSASGKLVNQKYRFTNQGISCA